MGKRLQITLKDEVAESLEKVADELGVTKSLVITLAIQDYEKKHNERMA